MNLAPTRGHCRLGTYGCNGSCAVKGCLIDKYAFQKNRSSIKRHLWHSFAQRSLSHPPLTLSALLGCPLALAHEWADPMLRLKAWWTAC